MRDRVATAAATPVCDVRTVAADVWSRLQRLLGGGVVAGSSTRRLVDTLSSISVYAAQNPRVNVHLHLTGHDQEGNTFWLPVHEDQQLLESAAGNVMAMVYRFAESVDAMQYGSDVTNPLLNGRTQAGGTTPGVRRAAEAEPPPTTPVPTSSAAPERAATSSGAAAGSADRRTLATEGGTPRAACSTPNPMSQVSTAPVGSRGPLLILPPGASSLAGSSSTAVSSGSRGVGLGLAGGPDATVRDLIHELSAEQVLAAAQVGESGDESSPNDGASATDAGSDGIKEEGDSDDYVMESRYLHSRCRSRVLKAPVTT